MVMLFTPCFAAALMALESKYDPGDPQEREVYRRMPLAENLLGPSLQKA